MNISRHKFLMGAVMRYVWSEHLSVGNETIDLDHKVLIGLIDGVVHAMEYQNCSVLSQAFELLDNKLRTHFHNEECIADAVKFPFTKNKEAHRFLLKEIGLIKNELLGKNGVCCEDAVKHFSDLLKRLLIDHITMNDMPMKPILQEYPYNLATAKLDRSYEHNQPVYMETIRAQ